MDWRDRLLHPSLRSLAVAARARFLAECITFGFLASLGFASIYVATGKLREAAWTVAGSAGLAASLGALRLLPSLERVTWSAMAVCLFLFAAPAITEPSLDPAVLAWVAVIPCVGAFLLPSRQALIWVLLSLATVTLLVLWRGQDAEPPDVWVSLARVLGLVVTIFVFGFRFSRQQARALVDLERANRAKSAFLATMSHEIRTPMNGVLGITEVLLSGPLEVETREKLNLVRESGHTLVALINDILDFSKIEAGKLQSEPTDFDLRLLIDDVTGLHRPSAQLKGVTLTVTIASELPRVVRGDALRLRQVLSNLVSNAVKFTERGEVRVVVESHPEHRVHFSVADTGIGIAAAVLGRLFTPFEQGDAGTTRRFGGTGLGLALSQNLVRLMGGDISVESVQGVGSRFTFSLTLEPGVMALSQSAIEARAPERKTDLPVLVVDDNVINLRVACSLVEKAGYRTETAANGQEALTRLESGARYLLVLMDCHMPVMDGFVATERIRSLDGDVAMTPIVALTASAMPEELEACKRAGMNDCLVKPVSLQTVRALLHRVEHYRGVTDAA